MASDRVEAAEARILSMSGGLGGLMQGMEDALTEHKAAAIADMRERAEAAERAGQEQAIEASELEEELRLARIDYIQLRAAAASYHGAVIAWTDAGTPKSAALVGRMSSALGVALYGVVSPEVPDA